MVTSRDRGRRKTAKKRDPVSRDRTKPRSRAKALAAGVLAVGLLAALAVTAAVLASGSPPDDGAPNPTVNTTATTTVAVARIAWHNFSDGMVLAEAQGKPVMVDFYADWCFWCGQLDANVYSDPRVVSAASDFVAVKEEITGDSPFIDRYSVYYLPVVLWLHPNGTTLTRLDGYTDAPTFLGYMHRALQAFLGWGMA